VTGVLPPLSQSDWQAEFVKYQAIPQYHELNRGMSLDQFKVIYWWEWSHRLLARVTGAVFLLPFLLFLWRGWIPPTLRLRLWTIFGAGAALGAVGWWMVASGLAGRISVSQYRLAFHLTLACAIYAAVLWTSQQIAPRPPGEAPARLRIGALAIAALLLLQIYLGALVAGLDAGLVYNTWPLIDDAFIPDAARLWFESPAWRNLFENTLTVQFNHRMLAYAIWLLAGFHAIDARQARRGAAGAIMLAVAVTLQSALGVVTLLYQTPLALALAHQVLAIIVLTIAVVHAERLAHRAAFGVAQPAEQGV
jgi:cytochrome c oxidase assembly protein subunit 15